MSKSKNKKYYTSNKTNFIPSKQEQKKDKKGLAFWIVFILIIFWTLASVLGSLSFFNVNYSADIPTAKAYSSDDATLNPYDYPNYNLLASNFIASQNWTSNGVTCSVNSDYSLSFSGVSTSDSYMYIPLGRYYSSSFPSGTYYQQGTVSDKVRIYTEAFSDLGWVGSFAWDNTFININYSNYTSVQVYLMISPRADVNGVVSYPSINKSDIVVPYSPPIDVTYYIGYDNGNIDSEFSSNYFYRSRFIFSKDSDPSQDIIYNVPNSVLIFGGVRLSNIPYDLTGYTKMTIQFYRNIPLQNLYLAGNGAREFFYTDNSDTPSTFNAYILNSSNVTSVLARFIYKEDLQSYGLQLSLTPDIDSSYRLNYFANIDLSSFSNVNDVIRSLVFFQSRTGYDLGYDDGYIDGEDNGYKNGYTQGVSDGVSQNVSSQVESIKQQVYDEGFHDGEIYGANHANDYSFLSLMGAVVDAPLQALSGFFGFEILGINLVALISGLFTLCVIVILLRILLGGGIGG